MAVRGPAKRLGALGAPLLSGILLAGVACSSTAAPAAVELTILDRRTLEPLEQGGPLRYGPSFQGGEWAMPALRASGVQSTGSVEGELLSVTGATLGTAPRAPVHLVAEPSGTLRADWLAIPLLSDALPPDATSTPATLHVVYVDAQGTSVESRWPVTLIAADGP